MIGNRGPFDLAGGMCAFKSETHKCDKYARYSVSGIDSLGRPVGPMPVCGTHMSMACRTVWHDMKSAAIVQEIPGMWR